MVSVSREIAAGPGPIFELIADPAQQPRWDGNDNLAGAAAGQRVRRAGDVFRMTLTQGQVRENHVVEFDEGRLIAWTPAEPGQEPPGHLWRWELEPAGASRTRVTSTYDWTRLTDETRLRGPGRQPSRGSGPRWTCSRPWLRNPDHCGHQTPSAWRPIPSGRGGNTVLVCTLSASLSLCFDIMFLCPDIVSSRHQPRRWRSWGTVRIPGCVEPGGGAGGLLAAGTGEDAGVRRALPSAHGGARRSPVAGGRVR